MHRVLGRTNLRVSCLGIGGGGGIGSDDVLYAFGRGINYFFFSGDLHHWCYAHMAGALRKLCGRGSSLRDEVVLATVTYVKDPTLLMSVLWDQFSELRTDYVDVLHLGCVQSGDSNALKNFSTEVARINATTVPRASHTMEMVADASYKLKRSGVIRYVAASFHDMQMAEEWLASGVLDVVMVRHNVVHRAAQTAIFRKGPPSARPGVVTFKSRGWSGKALEKAPSGLRDGHWIPKVPDFYRYSLSQPGVDVCLTGPRTRSEIDASLEGLERGPLSLDELQYLANYGDLFRCG